MTWTIFRRLFSGNRPASQKPLKRKTRWFRPGVERLESIIAPTNGYQDFAGLRFMNDQLNTNQTDCTVTGGLVDVGFAPTNGDSFVAIIEYNLGTSGTLKFNISDPQKNFAVANVTLATEIDPLRLPIWQSPTNGDSVDFNIPALINQDGVDLSSLTSTEVPIPYIPGIKFQLINIGLSPLNLATTVKNPQADLQGYVTFDAIPILKAKVANGSLLIADAKGMTLTGLDATFETPDFQEDGVHIENVGITASYSDTPTAKQFTFGGECKISTDPQGPDNTKAFNDVGGSLKLVINDGSLDTLDVSLSGTFDIARLNVSIDPNNPLDLKFGKDPVNKTVDEWYMSGAIFVTIKPAEERSNGFYIEGRLGYANEADDPGLKIIGGELESFNVLVNTEFTMFRLTVTTQGAGINLTYDKTTDTFSSYGNLAFIVDAGKPSASSFTITMGNSNTPGLLIEDGKLKALGFNLDLEKQKEFNVEGLGMTQKSGESAIAINWSDAVTQQNPKGQDILTIGGSVTLNGLSQVVVTLGGGSGQPPGIEIIGGEWFLDDFDIQVENVKFGSAFQLRNLDVHYVTQQTFGDPSADKYTLDVDVTVIFPLGWALSGNIGIVNGLLDSITVSVTAGGPGIPIADTGFFLTYVSIAVTGIQTPENLVFEGKVGVVYGDSTQIAGTDQNIVAATGDIKIDRNQFYLSGAVYVGAISEGTDQNGLPLYKGQLAEATGTVNLDWGAKSYSAKVHASFLDGTFVIDAGFSFSSAAGNTSILIYAMADVDIPDSIPIIGGKQIAGMAFIFDYHHAFGQTYGFVAAWMELDVIFHVEFGFQYDIQSQKFSLIGSQQIKADECCVTNPQACPTPEQNFYRYSKSFTVPEGATAATFSVHWPQPVGTQQIWLTPPNGSPIPSTQFSGNLTSAPQLNDSTRAAVHVVGSSGDKDQTLTAGSVYTLSMISSVKFDDADVTWSSGFHFEAPTISVAGHGLQNGSVIPVSLTGTTATSLASNATVTLYVDTNPSGYHGTPIGTAQSVPFSPTLSVPFDVKGLLPITYYVYAVINDGVNTPVFSPYSNAINPSFPLSGNVTDMGEGRNVGVGGLSVFLDLGGTGHYDIGDPITTTDPNGTYTFDSLQDGVSYPVTLILPDGVLLAPPPPTNPQTVTYHTGDQLHANFNVLVESSITGYVTHDGDSNDLLNGEGQSGITVFLDLNHNNTFDSNEPYSITLNNGSYEIFGVDPSTTYTVAMDTKSKSFTDTYYTTAKSAPQTITTGPGQFDQSQNVNFGLLQFSVISGNVGYYPYQNGVLDTSTNKPLANWTVKLLNSSGQTVQTIQTDSTGDYQFKVPGGQQYTVSQVLESGYLPNTPLTAVFKMNQNANSITVNNNASVSGVMFGDLDGDGFIDMATAGNNYDTDANGHVFWGDGSGNFSANNSTTVPNIDGQLVLADLDGDGRLDIVEYGQEAGPGVYFAKNKGGRNFASTQPLWTVRDTNGDSQPVTEVVAGDFDGDGRDDLAAIYADNFTLDGHAGVAVRLSNNGNISYNQSLDFADDLAVGDVNYDRKVDIVIAARKNGGNMVVLFGNGDGTFTLSAQAQQSGPIQAIGIGDLQNNGYLGASYFNMSNGNPNDNKAVSIGFSPYAPTGYVPNTNTLGVTSTDLVALQTFLIDMNGDYRADLVAAAYDGNNVWIRVWINNGTTNSTTNAASPYFNSQPDAEWEYSDPSDIAGGYPFAVADLNRDGLPDIAVANPNTGQVNIFYNQTTFTKTSFVLNLALEENSTDNDFINAQMSTINGSVANDLNRNGRIDPGDPLLDDVTVYLDLNKNRQFDPGIDRLATTHGGLYAFGNVPDGTYGVGVLLQPGRKASGAGDWQSFTIANGQPVSGVDFTLVTRLLNHVENQTSPDNQTLTIAVPRGPAPISHTPIYRLDSETPPGFVLDSATGMITWPLDGSQAPGNYPITVRITNPLNPAQTETESFTITVTATPVNQFIRNLYLDVLGRTGDSGDFVYWNGQLAGPMTRAQVSTGFWTSVEHRGMQVASYYVLFLHRAVDVDGLKYWTGVFTSGKDETDVMSGLVTSLEYHALHPSASDYVTALYQDLLGRGPDQNGLTFFLGQISDGSSDAFIVHEILFSDEALVGWIDDEYMALLHRLADLDGGLYWLGLMKAGSVTRSGLAEAILASDEYYSG